MIMDISGTDLIDQHMGMAKANFTLQMIMDISGTDLIDQHMGMAVSKFSQR